MIWGMMLVTSQEELDDKALKSAASKKRRTPGVAAGTETSRRHSAPTRTITGAAAAAPRLHVAAKPCR